MTELITTGPEIEAALTERRPVVALESTLITHGLPFPENLRCARNAQDQIRLQGATPATIAVLDGQIRIGLEDAELERISQDNSASKLSRHDLATACARGLTGGTTVAATMICARKAGIAVFATGGIGGVHRGWNSTLDISADLQELARTQVTVVCSGAKSLLDLPATIEMLETLGVPVVGFGTDELPAFFSAQSGISLHQFVDNLTEAADIIRARRQLDLSGGEVLAVPPPETLAVTLSDLENWTQAALAESQKKGITGKSVTPYLLGRIADLSSGATLAVNTALILNNAEIAGRLAVTLSQ
ncbi:MAG: pseudouridine-5'-phosphate glycosidase [Arenicellales bacterium]|jgi:pseudouridine-5'-phosphate glycosidase|nr:pseudouridine-5'-phosphate glycosidase [Arenicellales bacterium]|tara:strand:- start:79 stop:987 length:909 start_codon:yes stop_codon:yes gene_type:complete